MRVLRPVLARVAGAGRIEGFEHPFRAPSIGPGGADHNQEPLSHERRTQNGASVEVRAPPTPRLFARASRVRAGSAPSRA
jgi:hypothetical protein